MKHACPAALILASALLHAPGNAATFADPSFQASLALDGTDYGPFDGQAGAVSDACDGLFGDQSDCDLIADVNGDIPRIVLNWVSATSFDVAFDVSDGSLGSSDTVAFTLLLSGLDYLVGGIAAPITAFAFNLADSEVEGFLQSPDNPGGTFFTAPETAFTATTVSAKITLSGQLEGDAPLLRFDVSASGQQPPAVPLPAAGWMLGLGLAGLFAARRWTA